MFAPLEQTQNLAYLVLIVAVWVTIFAAIIPGTGALEATAAVTIFLAAFAILTLPINLWALVLILLALGAFILELRRPAKGIFLILSMILFAVGSAFLFQGPNGEAAGVAWWIAAIGSMLTVGFFGLAFNTYLHATRSAVMDFSADKVIGQIGTAKSEIHDQGAVQVASALWTAHSDTTIPAGAKVKVVAREGLVLIVKKAE
jgi:membrane-bound serine protease (ClpP class)